jgi:hypothetical protein
MIDEHADVNDSAASDHGLGLDNGAGGHENTGAKLRVWRHPRRRVYKRGEIPALSGQPIHQTAPHIGAANGDEHAIAGGRIGQRAGVE